ncbi:MAG: nucleotidyltransferase domain-containing protein [Thermoprotei archaeon]|nr:MAG: nucleotidyltransferase domain-containing protein [Thermoprotei archaeon]
MLNIELHSEPKWRTAMGAEVKVKELERIDEPYRTLIKVFLDELLKAHEQKLVSVAVFGSVARGDYRRTSDIDVLIVMRNIRHRSRMRRYYMIIDAIESIEDMRVKISEMGIFTGVSPVILDYEEAKYFRPLYIELVHDAVILYDKDNFLTRLLKTLGRLLVEKYGAKREVMGRRWYWIFTRGNPLIDLCGVKLVE